MILCEDKQQYSFVRRYLKQNGFGREIHLIDLPASNGSGFTHVLKRYAGELRDYRRRSTHTSSAFFVVIDADQHDVEARYAQLDETLSNAKLGQRTEKEHVILLIPKRNIETWIHCLLHGKAVNEEEPYGKFSEPSACHPAADLLAEMRKANAAPLEIWVPSLVTGYEELLRLNS